MSRGLTYDQLFPGRFVKAGEMDGKPVTLTIKAVYLDTLEQEDGTEKQQAIVSFTEIKRELALNKTNAQCLVALWSDDSGEWIGHKVTLFPEHDTSGLSQSGVCIRVKGSPDIDKPVKVEVKLPRRRPVPRTLVPTGKGKAAVAPPETDDNASSNDDDFGFVDVPDNDPALGLDEAVQNDAPEPVSKFQQTTITILSKKLGKELPGSAPETYDEAAKLIAEITAKLGGDQGALT